MFGDFTLPVVLLYIVSTVFFCAEIQKFQQIVSQVKEMIDNIASEVEKEKMKASNWIQFMW